MSEHNGNAFSQVFERVIVANRETPSLNSQGEYSVVLPENGMPQNSSDKHPQAREHDIPASSWIVDAQRKENSALTPNFEMPLLDDL